MAKRHITLASMAIVATFGCRDATGPGVRAAIAGTYALRTVNGLPLPYQDQATQYGRVPTEVLSSHLTLTDTAYRDVGNDRGNEFVDRWQSDSADGASYDYTYVVWRVKDGRITITPLDGLAPIAGTVQGDTLVLTERNALHFPDGVYVYVKVPWYQIPP